MEMMMITAVLTRALSLNTPAKAAPAPPSSTSYVNSILAVYTQPDLPLVQRFRDNLAWVNGGNTIGLFCVTLSLIYRYNLMRIVDDRYSI
jgi:hypothetical protein